MKTMVKKGFTLIELLVVITIIGILATGATAVYSSAQAKARDAIRISDLDVVSKSAAVYATEHSGVHPGLALTETSAGASLLVLEGDYIKAMPREPKSAQTYVYNTSGASANHDRIEFSANLESASNDTKEQGDGGSANDNSTKGTARYEVGDLKTSTGTAIDTGTGGGDGVAFSGASGGVSISSTGALASIS